ncbi:hypothetical protein AB433_15890 [Croceicoccus naphthovorans]|uniref:Uncharacterized protein n=1 Tax=Croceicoccus naphthovorans TaxID=1348774 RepID=A0A0G3XKI7_9SPHN|nr:hypothetical protein AB433_15890 [Croceicoccus naphthovorans]
MAATGRQRQSNHQGTQFPVEGFYHLPTSALLYGFTAACPQFHDNNTGVAIKRLPNGTTSALS